MFSQRYFGPLVFAAIALPGLAGCGDDNGPQPPTNLTTVSSQECASELKWTGGNQGSPRMHPGGDCIGCHRNATDAPTFAVAGTVYADPSAETGCAGVEGATVVVTDNAGDAVALETNQAGNFYLQEADADLEMPLEVTVRYEGREHAMQEPIYSGNCYNCHSGPTAVRAPRRVLIPQGE